MGSRGGAMLRLLLFVGVVCCMGGQNMASQYSVVADQMSQLLRIRQQINMDFSPFALAPHQLAHEVRSLGDGADSSSPKVDAHSNTAALLRLDRVITQYQLAALQSDEESITNGIEKLLHSIQSGNAMHVADALKPDADKKTPEGTLTQRATSESKRLTQLEEELQQQGQTDQNHLRQHSKERVPTIRVPLPKLRHQLSGLVSTELDHTLNKFKTMRDA